MKAEAPEPVSADPLPEKLKVCLLNDSFPPVVDGVANAVVNYARCLTAEEAGQADLTAAASILAMADMGLFTLDLEANPIALTRNNRPKAEPQDSAVWRWMQGLRE